MDNKKVTIKINNCSNDKKYWNAYIGLVGTNNMSFDITAIPNQLIITGDAGDFIIGRVSDEQVINIFNTNTSIYDYWISKVLAGKPTVNVIRPIKEIVFNIIDGLYTEKVQNELGEDYNYKNIDKIYDSLLNHSKDEEQYKITYNILDSILSNNFISTIDSGYPLSDIAEEIYSILDEYNDDNELTLDEIEDSLTKDEISYNFKYICDTLKDSYNDIMKKLDDFLSFEDYVDKAIKKSYRKQEVSSILEILYRELYKALDEKEKSTINANTCLRQYKMAKKCLEDDIRTYGIHNESKSRFRDIAHFKARKELWVKASKKSRDSKKELNRVLTAINALYRVRDEIVVVNNNKKREKKNYFYLSDKEIKSLRLILAEYLNDDNKNTPTKRCLEANELYCKISSFLDKRKLQPWL